jgi:Uma2 family endonuclease
MGEPAVRLHSYEEYLRIEQESGLKHEFFEGHVVAMAGGSVVHAELCGRVIEQLAPTRKGRPCRSFSSELKIASPSGLSSYADASIVCGPIAVAAHDRHAVTNPSLLVEVLSPSTAHYDQCEKFEHVRQIPTLMHYLLVSTDRVGLQHRSRNGDGSWTLRYLGGGERLLLPDLGLEIEVDALYGGIDLSMASG